MMKKALSMFLIGIMVFAAFMSLPITASAEATEQAATASVDWSGIYYRYITENSDSVPFGSDSTFEINDNTPLSLYDYDKDGVPELLIGYIGARGRTAWSVFTLNGTTVNYAGGNAGKETFYSLDERFPGIFRTDSINDKTYLFYSELVNGTLVSRDVRYGVYNQSTKQYDYTVYDNELYNAYLGCTTASGSSGGVEYRVANNYMESVEWQKIRADGWDSFVARYGYSTVNDDWSDMYYSHIMNHILGHGNVIKVGSGMGFSLQDDTRLALHDYDMDGVPELIFTTDSSGAGDLVMSAYMIYNGKITYIGGGMGGSSVFYSDNSAYHGIFSDRRGQIYYAGLSDGNAPTWSVAKYSYNSGTGKYTYTISDEKIYNVFLECTTSDSSNYRIPKNTLKTYSWKEIRTDGWDSFVERYLNGYRNNELDFSKDVWNFRNYKDTRCYLEDEISDNYYKNPYIENLSPANRAAIKAKIADGTDGHCFGMSVTVILQKLGLEDLTKWDGVDCLRKVGGMGISRSRICYYHAMQYLWDFEQEVQRFQNYSVAEQLELLSQRANNVKNGGNPVLLCFGKKGWGAHAVVAYALEPGMFVSSSTGKRYDRRILLYDCNNVEWNGDYCFLFNEGTDQWEIPSYAEKKVASSDGAYLMCASTDTRAFDAADDIEQMQVNANNPVVSVNSSKAIIMKNTNTGERWTINSREGQITGSIDLFSYYDLNVMDEGNECIRLNIILPDPNAEYVFETASGQSSDYHLSVLYPDKYLSVESESATGATLSSDGIVSLTGNKGEYEIVAADDRLRQDGRYDTFSVKGNNNDTSLSLLENGVSLKGDDIEGTVVKASNETDSGITAVKTKEVADLRNNKDDYNPVSLLGDADGNGAVEAMDTALVLRSNAQLTTPFTKEELLRGDVDGSGELEISDATYIQYYLAQIATPYLIGVEVYDAPLQPAEDTIRPYITVSCKAETSASQKITLKMTDNLKVKRYGMYRDPYGELNGASGYMKFVDVDTDTVTVTVDQPGRYFFVAEDSSGNRSIEKSIDIMQYMLEPNGGSTSVSTALSGKNSFLLPIPVRSGFRFIGWSTQKPADYTGSATSSDFYYSEFEPKYLYANWLPSESPAESIKPTVSIEYDEQKYSRIMLYMSDSSGILGYYWGTDPDYRKNLFVPSSKTSAEGSPSNPGTYYLNAVDIYGNVSETASIDYDEVILNANGGIYSQRVSLNGTAPLTRDFAATSFCRARGREGFISAPQRSGYVFEGWAERPNAVNGEKTIITSGSKTYYAVWKKDPDSSKKLCYSFSGGDSWGYDGYGSGGLGIVRISCYYSVSKKQYDFEIAGVSKGSADVTLYYKEDVFGDYTSVPVKVYVDDDLTVHTL